MTDYTAMSPRNREPYDRYALAERAVGDLLSRRNEVAQYLGELDTGITSALSNGVRLPASDIREFLGRRNTVAHDLELVDAQIEYTLYDLCGTMDDPQDVETYDGKLGVSRKFVDDHEAPVGQLVWFDDLPQRFSGTDDPGTVNAQRWGTGALIADNLFLTAGHCFQPDPRRWKVPSRNGTPISAAEIAQLMCVYFNYQKNGATGQMRPGAVFPVVGLLEYSTKVDYAIVQLGPDALGRLPGRDDLYGKLRVAKKVFPEKNDILCIIQHPNGNEKKVEAGHLMDIRDGRIAYNDIGTFGGASGSPILYEKTGEIVGVHVKGGSLPIGGFNSGTTVAAIHAVSHLI